jgi:hypothetical protein
VVNDLTFMGGSQSKDDAGSQSGYDAPSRDIDDEIPF